MTQPVSERWPALFADAESMAERYQDRGWEPTVLDPEQCGIDDTEPPGLRVTVPADDHEVVDEAVKTGPFDTSHVYRATDEETGQFLVAVEARTQERAVVVPVAVAPEDLETLETRVAGTGSMHTHVDSAGGEERVTFSHDDPSLFFD